MARPTCQRCGDELPVVEVTTFSDPEPVWLPTHNCDCPGPRCPLCSSRIDKHTAATWPGQCPNTDCALWGAIIPLPEVD